MAIKDDVAQAIWQEYAASVGRSLPTGLADRLTQIAIQAMKLTPVYAVVYGDDGQSEECWEHRDQAEDMLAEYTDATGLDDGYIVTAEFTGWRRA